MVHRCVCVCVCVYKQYIYVYMFVNICAQTNFFYYNKVLVFQIVQNIENSEPQISYSRNCGGNKTMYCQKGFHKGLCLLE